MLVDTENPSAGPLATEPLCTLIFSLGSVQQFMQEARRTQDLWMGSFMISYLTWRALEPIVRECGVSAVVMPALGEQPLYRAFIGAEKVSLEELAIANLPNIFTALVPAARVRPLAAKAEEAVGAALQEIATAVFETLRQVRDHEGREVVQQQDRTTWELQAHSLKDGLGIFWGACEWIADSEDAASALEPLAAFAGVDRYPPTSGTVMDPTYHVCAAAAGRAHSNRKNLRDFRQPPQDGSGHKCSQCGIRRQVRPQFDDLDGIRTTSFNGRKVKLFGRLRTGDRLCAVCLMKRLAWEHYFLPMFRDRLTDPLSIDAHLLFPSTSSFASARFKEEVLLRWGELATHVGDFITKLRALVPEGDQTDLLLPSPLIPRLRIREASKGADPEVADAFVRLEGAALYPSEHDTAARDEQIEDWLRLEGAWLYPDELSAEGIRLDYGVTQPTEEALREASRALKRLLDAAEALGIRQPSPYLAVLAMDGDKMGEWVSGGHPAFRGYLSREYQNELAAGLRDFALRKVPEIVHEKHLGRLLYAGGDDVLALFPVRDALDAAQALNHAFGETVTPRVPSAGNDHRYPITLSGAIVLVHRSEILSFAIERSHHLLKEAAKKKFGRDALAIEVLLGSGGEIVAGGPWSDGSAEMVTLLGALCRLFRSGSLSASLPKDLSRAEAALGEWPTAPPAASVSLREVQRGELRRLVGRRSTAAMSKAAEDVLLGLHDVIATRAAPLAGSEWSRLAAAVTAAQFLTREE